MKTVIFVLCIALAVVFRCLTSWAQSGEEMQVLRMFYNDEDLVISPTRHPKPISQVAENITVITAKEIEDMNAHTVAEVLDRVPGLFINFNRDFGATSLIQAQGSEERHVLVLTDGIPWNFLNSGGAETNSIPVGIIERIEVIKGPGSSAWGSALGGVVNIITRPAGTTERPTGTISASYGKEDTQDYRAGLAGRAGSVGYYLFAGSQDADGLRSSREFDGYSLYSKFNIPLSTNVAADLSMGYTQPDIGLGDFITEGLRQSAGSHVFFATASLSAPLTRELNLSLSLHHLKQKSILTNNSLGWGLKGPPGVLYLETEYDEKTTGGHGKLVFDHGQHTAVLGVDIDHGKLDQVLEAGAFLQLVGAPARSTSHPDMDTWAVYANDTIVLGRWSVTPGIRYDHNSITGSFVSPSLGVTCLLGNDSLIRASAARGFTIPPLSWTSGGALFLDPNRSLDHEEVWSCQAGVESRALPYLWVKATLFRHEVDDTLTKDLYGAGPPGYNDLYANDGEITRHGLELEAETLPFYNMTVSAGYACAHMRPSNEHGSDNIYSCNIGIRYDDNKSFTAELFGHYVWWDLDKAWGASYDDFIWDLNLRKKILSRQGSDADLFLTAHNLFSGSQYTYIDSRNPETWLEAGMRLRF
ncbi:MAG: TonB-dependent receptor [Thermodesulfobacteriota bacterium]|nr:TonB-dependent receptor [Thermodesulfobacteriota bacterium]